MISFAPGAKYTDGEAAHPGPSLRRRGPRSEESQELRKLRNTTIALIVQTRNMMEKQMMRFQTHHEKSTHSHDVVDDETNIQDEHGIISKDYTYDDVCVAKKPDVHENSSKKRMTGIADDIFHLFLKENIFNNN